MAKRKKGIIITSTCALLAGAAVIAELALGGGTGGNGVGRQQGWQNLQKEIFDSAYSEESYDSAVEVPEYEGLTDITKIRVYRCQAGPMSVEEIFNKQK